ncbi:hypothetical protein cyc_07209 [Cyclospora cayetanensis]|uniref:Uncharacterized protein n=1 Tax=Cyclospora cayetanensis TaxID=88456 RepID=A0A1D3D372_9EIME|nr:hypothetical protein cyc_07209 [Cyclospora cayetanensis]
MAAALIGLLNEAAGEYVEGLERSQLDFSGILTGKVLLRHLQLKKKAFEVLPLPVRPEFNYIGLVQLDLPVYSLGTAPILGELKDVLVLLSVESSGNWNAEDFLRHYHERKAAALAAGEYKALFSSLERGLLWQLLLKLLSSFTARVRDVHIRIEDRHSISSQPFALGICLKSAVLHAAPRGSDFSEPGVCRVGGSLAEDTFLKVLSVEGKSYNDACREAYEAITAQLLRDAGTSGGADYGHYRQSVAGFGLLTGAMAWKNSSGREGAEGPCANASAFCCDTSPSLGGSRVDSGILPFEDMREKRRSRRHPRRSSSGGAAAASSERPLSPPETRRNASGSRGGAPPRVLSPQAALQPSVSSLEERGGPSCLMTQKPEISESWIPLLRRYCVEPSNGVEATMSGKGSEARGRASSTVSVGGSSKTPADSTASLNNLLSYARVSATKSVASGDETQERFQRDAAAEDGFYDVVEGPPSSFEGAANEADHTPASSAPLTAGSSVNADFGLMVPLDKSKLSDFRQLLSLLWDVQHEYVISPNTFRGQAKLFLTLVPTLPPDAPLERCWSLWGQMREAERVKQEQALASSLPSCTLFVTLPGVKATLDCMQALQLWKWLEYCFVLHDSSSSIPVCPPPVGAGVETAQPATFSCCVAPLRLAAWRRLCVSRQVHIRVHDLRESVQRCARASRRSTQREGEGRSVGGVSQCLAAPA